MTQTFSIVWRGPTPNQWPGRSGQPKPIAIVNHIMQGTQESTDGWFKNPKSEVSAHFGVAKDGRIWQWVKEMDTAWANGVVSLSNVSPQWLVQAVGKNINPNYLTISIEHEGFSGDVMPAAQYQATLWLHKKLIKDWQIPVDREHLVGHYQIDIVNKRGCPGNGFPWGQLMQDLTLPDFQPNPDGFSVGPGMLAKLTEIREQAMTAEQFYSPNPGQPPGLAQRSFLWTKQGSMLVAFQDVGGADGKQPLATWTVRRYKEQ